MLTTDAFRYPGWIVSTGKFGLRIFLWVGLLACGFAGKTIRSEDRVEAHPKTRPMPVGKAVQMAAGTATLISVDSLPWVTNEYSARFRYDSADNPKLAALRKRHSLDAVVAPGKDEFQKQLLLMDWTHRQFRKFGKPTSDARGAAEILAGIEAGHTDLMDSGYDYGKMFIVKDGVCDGTQWHERKVPAQPLMEPYFPIGQASLRILEEGGRVVVQIDTLTPNLARFEVRLDGGEWIERPARWVWHLRPGRNRMEARTVNRFGVTGPESEAVVELVR
jgi:hypothetical protein